MNSRNDNMILELVQDADSPVCVYILPLLLMWNIGLLYFKICFLHLLIAIQTA